MTKEKLVLEPASLEIRQVVSAEPERVFEAWTDPAQLQQWWGPEGVTCVAAEIDLKVGGRYRIGNELPDKRILWIEGKFEVIDRPRLLEYTWSTNPQAESTEKVIVRFEAIDGGTEILIAHHRIPNEAIRDDHESGWLGCLKGLDSFVQH